MTISRRRFIGTALTAGATGLVAKGAMPEGNGDLLLLESHAMRLAIDRATGCLNRIESKDGAWRMRGGGMRLHVPAPDHRFHYLSEHHAAKPHIESDGTEATIRWSGFASERMGKLDIDVREDDPAGWQCSPFQL